MRYFLLSIFIVLTLLISLVVVRVLTRGGANHPSYVAFTHNPVLLVHGFNLHAAVDCTGSAFPYVPGYLRSNGWQGPIITVGFYAGDTNCTVKLTTYQANCKAIYAGNIGTVGTINEDLRHIACELAWYLYDMQSSHAENVQIVAQSIGGLIVRAMVANIGQAGWPRTLYLQDAVTMGTPHGGLLANTPFVACGGCWQTAQMTIGSRFLATLAQNPQASHGTDWTMLGSDCDAVPWTSATAMYFGHKIVYHTPCYLHGGYLTDTSNIDNAVVNWSFGMPTSVANHEARTWPHSLHLMLSALEESSAW